MVDEPVEIFDDDELLRRVLPYCIVGETCVSSGAFKDRRKKPLNKFSTGGTKLLGSRSECLARPGVPPNMRLIGFMAKTPRSLDLRVWHDPEDGDRSHCSVEGENSSDKCDILAGKSWPIPANGL